MKQILFVLTFLSLQNSCFGQVTFDPCRFFEDFFSNVSFEDIPYFIPGSAEPKMSVSEAKDTLVQVIDLETYEWKYVNQKTYVQEQWDRFNELNQYVKNRDSKSNDFHLVNTNIELREKEDIKEILQSSGSKIPIDTAGLEVYGTLSSCETFKHYEGQCFMLNKSLENLSKSEEFNLRGFFQFSSVFLTDDKHHAIITYHIYHKWINPDGKATSAETGGGGIIVISLSNEQRIVYTQRLFEY